MASSGPEDHYYQAVYDSLLRLDEDGKPAATWPPSGPTTPTNTTLSLTLRDDVTFTDGDRVRRRGGQGEPGERQGRPPARPAPRWRPSTT